MSVLSFETFLAKYVRSLSATDTIAIKSLVKEASSTNVRLREPLFLYAYAHEKMDLLLRFSKDTSLVEEYKQLSDTYTYEDDPDNAVIARACELLLEAGEEPPVFMSGNIDGGDEFNRRVMAERRDNIFYL